MNYFNEVGNGNNLNVVGASSDGIEIYHRICYPSVKTHWILKSYG